jgi:cation/acetate symporter
MLSNSPALREALGRGHTGVLWWGIQPVSAGVFGVPAGFLATLVISAVTGHKENLAPDFRF